MYTLDRAILARGDRGRPIEIPFRDMDELVKFRTGQLAILGGAAGAGKTTFAINWAWHSKQPILWFAQDDFESTVRSMIAMGLDIPKSDVESDPPYWAEKVRPRRREELIVIPDPQSVADMQAHIVAMTEWLMEPPHMVVVENLYNVKAEGLSYADTGYYAAVVPALLEMAVTQDVGVFALHHVNRAEGLGSTPLVMTDLLYGGEKESAHVWGVYHREDKRQMYVQILKQRNGRGDSSGGLSVKFDWTPNTGRLWRT